MERININLATEKELKDLPGIGNVSAKKIADFRASGGKFNSIEEIASVVNVRKSYMESLISKVDFGDVNKEIGARIPMIPGRAGIIDDIVLDPRAPVLEFPLPIFNSYSFTVQLKGLGDNTLPTLHGYKLIVGYRIGNYQGNNQTTYQSKSITYNLGVEPSQRVNITKPLISSSFIEDTFTLMIVSPNSKTIFDSSFEIDEDATVEIGLPLHSEKSLEIELDKQEGVNYSGYQLEVRSQINRASSGVETEIEKFDIGGANKFLVEFDAFGGVEEITIIVISKDGPTVVEGTKSWGDFQGTGQAKTVTIPVPKPTLVDYTIKLVIDPDQLNNPYLDHKVIVTYELKDPDTLNYINEIEKVFLIGPDGKAKVNFDYYGLIEDLKI
nr:helix-hairpin-helix domain-containing protein [Bacteroidota bacterium]